MRKKATLLVTHIHKLYTCKEIDHHMVVLSNAYVGIYHDVIMEIGIGDYHHLIDKDTRVVDASGHIMVPGFIDVSMTLPKLQRFDEARILQETAISYMRHGVTSLYIDEPKPIWYCASYMYEIYWQKQQTKGYPMVDLDMIVTQNKRRKQFCISTGYDSQNPLLSAQLYHIKHHISCKTLLNALCKYPAKRLQLHHVGIIDTGMQADALLINALDLEEMFTNLQDQKIYQVIKKGVRIYPNVIV